MGTEQRRGLYSLVNGMCEWAQCDLTLRRLWEDRPSVVEISITFTVSCSELAPRAINVGILTASLSVSFYCVLDFEWRGIAVFMTSELNRDWYLVDERLGLCSIGYLLCKNEANGFYRHF